MSSVYLLVAQAGPCVPCLPHLLLWRWHMTDRHTKYSSPCLSCHLPRGQLGLELHCSSRLLGLPSPPWSGLLRCTFLQLCNVRECFYPFCSSFTPPEPGSYYLPLLGPLRFPGGGPGWDTALCSVPWYQAVPTHTCNAGLEWREALWIRSSLLRHTKKFSSDPVEKFLVVN